MFFKRQLLAASALRQGCLRTPSSVSRVIIDTTRWQRSCHFATGNIGLQNDFLFILKFAVDFQLVNMRMLAKNCKYDTLKCRQMNSV